MWQLCFFFFFHASLSQCVSTGIVKNENNKSKKREKKEAEKPREQTMWWLPEAAELDRLLREIWTGKIWGDSDNLLSSFQASPWSWSSAVVGFAVLFGINWQFGGFEAVKWTNKGHFAFLSVELSLHTLTFNPHRALGLESFQIYVGLQDFFIIKK